MKFFSKFIYLLLLLVLANTTSYAWVKPTKEEIKLDNAIENLCWLTRFSSGINPSSESSANEKQKFFEAIKVGTKYEPQFSYRKVSEKAIEAAKELRKTNLKTGYYKNYLMESKNLVLKKLELLSYRGKTDFTKISSQLFPLPTKEEVTLAKLYIKTHGVIQKAKNLPLSDKEMAAELLKILKKRGLNKWRVRISNHMSANASVSPSSRYIQIRQGVRFNKENVKRFIHHEIGVHAQRAENGHAMPLKIFRIGLKDYLVTEEGMAANNEERHGIHEGLDFFALRVLTVDWASKMSFSGVFNSLRKLGVDKERAWKLTQRAKRGLTDTSIPGCYSKDCSYFRGFLLVKNYLVNGGSWKNLMRFGKVSINHINNLVELEKNSRVILGQDF